MESSLNVDSFFLDKFNVKRLTLKSSLLNLSLQIFTLKYSLINWCIVKVGGTCRSTKSYNRSLDCPPCLVLFKMEEKWRIRFKWASEQSQKSRHFSTRVREHLVSDRASHIFKHLENSEHCHDLCSVDCFHILDHASTTFQLNVKEAFHIRRKQPSLNQQLHHVNLKLSL